MKEPTTTTATSPESLDVDTSARRGQSRLSMRPRINAEQIERLSDTQLLATRFCDFDLTMEGTSIEKRISQLCDELAERGFRFRPHFWLSVEWFTPDGVPGIAIPFYLAHPRLARLERKKMLEVEGGAERWCMRILRHEAGHAIDNAYRLHRMKSWQQVFGKTTVPYPDFYQPKPFSKSFVLHLDSWYAQSHPAEDFAETFAVWLRPKSQWRSRYKGWPALTKLKYVDELMKKIIDSPPVVTTRRQVEPLSQIRRTLAEHYADKCARYAADHPEFYDRDLHRLFPPDETRGRKPSAAKFLGGIRAELGREVAYWTGEYQYTIDQVIGEMIDRCRELKLKVTKPADVLKQETMILVTIQTMNYLHAGFHRVAL